MNGKISRRLSQKIILSKSLATLLKIIILLIRNFFHLIFWHWIQFLVTGLPGEVSGIVTNKRLLVQEFRLYLVFMFRENVRIAVRWIAGLFIIIGSIRISPFHIMFWITWTVRKQKRKDLQKMKIFNFVFIRNHILLSHWLNKIRVYRVSLKCRLFISVRLSFINHAGMGKFDALICT